MKNSPRMVQIDNPIYCHGFMVSTTEKNMMKDISEVYKKIMSYKKKNEITGMTHPWEYISLSTNFAGSSSWDYYTGYVVCKDVQNSSELISYTVPNGEYAVFKLRCKSKILFGFKMGMLKREIYTKWLPSSQYSFDNFEYEYSNEEMWKKSPYDIDLYVKVTKKI